MRRAHTHTQTYTKSWGNLKQGFSGYTETGIIKDWLIATVMEPLTIQSVTSTKVRCEMWKCVRASDGAGQFNWEKEGKSLTWVQFENTQNHWRIVCAHVFEPDCSKPSHTGSIWFGEHQKKPGVDKVPQTHTHTLPLTHTHYPINRNTRNNTERPQHSKHTSVTLLKRSAAVRLTDRRAAKFCRNAFQKILVLTSNSQFCWSFLTKVFQIITAEFCCFLGS